ncbi:MAG: HIRAN domain-containing protein, partial [Clostridiales bacterium]|nr:HIRAN domain-containing protein [Clostridiales bacterium]
LLKIFRGCVQLALAIFGDILLFDTYIAGTSHIENMEALEPDIKPGDRLNFFREADNEYDANAIVIKTTEDEKVGYVPKKDNIVFSRLMDAGKLLFGTVKSKELLGSWVKIYIDIYMHE